MQTSELEIYAKSGLIISSTAVMLSSGDSYCLQVVTSISGKTAHHVLHTARNQVRKFKSLDTLTRMFFALPHTQLPLLYVEKELDA